LCSVECMDEKRTNDIKGRPALKDIRSCRDSFSYREWTACTVRGLSAKNIIPKGEQIVNPYVVPLDLDRLWLRSWPAWGQHRGLAQRRALGLKGLTRRSIDRRTEPHPPPSLWHHRKTVKHREAPMDHSPASIDLAYSGSACAHTQKNINTMDQLMQCCAVWIYDKKRQNKKSVKLCGHSLVALPCDRPRIFKVRLRTHKNNMNGWTQSL